MSNPKLKVSACPDFSCITSNAIVSYHAELVDPENDEIPEGTKFKWMCINDPSTTKGSAKPIFYGPEKRNWENAKWSFSGRHKIVLVVTWPNGTKELYEKRQWVDESANIVGREFDPSSNNNLPGPFHVLNQKKTLKKVLKDIEKTNPPPKEKKEDFEKYLKQIEEYTEHLEHNLKGLHGKKGIAVDALHIDDETSKRTSLLVYLIKKSTDEERPNWVLVDWTNPINRSTTGVYSGEGYTDQEAVKELIQNWDKDNSYPKGVMQYEFKVPAHLINLRGQFKTDGQSFFEEVASWLDYVALGSAVAAGVITFVLPVPGSRVVSIALWTSILSSTAASGINLSARHQAGFENWKDDVFDGLSIVGNLFAAGGLWKLGAKVSSASLGIGKASLIGQMTTDGLQGILLGETYLSQYKSIQNNKNLSPDERLSKLMELFRSALVTGALTYVSFKGTKQDLENLSSGTTLHSIKDVENPSTSIDLDKEINTVKVNSENNGQRIQIATEPKASSPGKKSTSAEAKNADVNKQKNDSPADKEKGHPVNCITGAVVDTQTDFIVPGRIPLVWQRHYNSQQKDLPGLSIGHGWRTPADSHVISDENGLVVFSDGSPGGSVFKFLPSENNYIEDETGQKRLENKDNNLVVIDKSGLKYKFPLIKETDKPEYLEEIRDQNNNWIRFIRDDSGLSEINTSANSKLKINTIFGKIKHIYLCLEDGTTRDLVEYDYDMSTGDLTEAADSCGGRNGFGYKNHLMTRVVTKTGVTFRYEYDNLEGINSKCIHTFGDDNLYDYRFEYSENNDRTIITNSLNHKEIFEYDENSRPLKIYDHENNLTSYEYDSKGRPLSITDPSGARTDYNYDKKGNLTSITRPDKTKVYIEYDADDNPVKVTDPNKNTWEQNWDEKGRLSSRVSPYGAKTEYKYNEKGDLSSITDPKGAVTTLVSDETGNISEIRDPLGNTTGLELDKFGNVKTVTDPMGNVTAYEYDEKSRLVKTIKPSGKTIECVYDSDDNLVEYKDESGEITGFEYTGINKVFKRKNPDGSIVKYDYDTEEQLRSVTNEKGETYFFERDHSGRIVKETDYYRNSKNYKYDGSGKLIYAVDALGQKTEFKYDELGRVSQKELSDKSIETFKYDPNGNLTEFENKSALVKRVFDSENRIITEEQNQNIVRNEYDLTGNRVRRRTSQGNDVRYEYDIAGNPEKIRINDETIDIKRDKTGLAKKEIFSSGIERNYTHNKDGLLTKQQIFSEETLKIKRTYEYDVLGNLIAKKDDTKGESYFTYNPANQIIKSINPEKKIEEFLYDPAGDLFKKKDTPQKSEKTDKKRELTHKETDYLFDEAGNLIEKTENEETTRFLWNKSGQLEFVTKPDSTKISMLYDGASRRISKETANIRTTFSWDGDYLLSDNIGEDNYREFVYYPDSFEPLAFIDKENEIFYFHNDAVGLPHEITDSENNIVWSARYDGFGRIEKLYENKVNNPIRFQGQYYDEELDLSYNRHRYFDADTGSFISIDPLGLEAGTNLYRYAPNVWGWIDPLGLCGEISNSADDFITVYRGDKQGTKFIKSYAAKKGGYRYSQNIIDNGNIDELLKAHAVDSKNPSSPFISTTTDKRVAQFFAGSDGVVNKFKISKSRIIKNKYNTMTVPAGPGQSYISESEWLVPNYIKPNEFIGLK